MISSKALIAALLLDPASYYASSNSFYNIPIFNSIYKRLLRYLNLLVNVHKYSKDIK